MKSSLITSIIILSYRSFELQAPCKLYLYKNDILSRGITNKKSETLVELMTVKFHCFIINQAHDDEMFSIGEYSTNKLLQGLLSINLLN